MRFFKGVLILAVLLGLWGVLLPGASALEQPLESAKTQTFPEYFNASVQKMLALTVKAELGYGREGRAAATACDQAYYADIRSRLWQDILDIQAERRQAAGWIDRSDPGIKPQALGVADGWNDMFVIALRAYHNLRMLYEGGCGKDPALASDPADSSRNIVPLTLPDPLPTEPAAYEAPYEQLEQAIHPLIAEAETALASGKSDRAAALARRLDAYGPTLKRLGDHLRELAAVAPPAEKPAYKAMALKFYDLAFALIEARNRLSHY